MKTAIALFAAALSVTALATNASAQPRMASNLGTTFPSVVAEKGSNILQQAGPSINTGNRGSISIAPLPSPSPRVKPGASINTGKRGSISIAPLPSPSPRVKVPAPDKHHAYQTQAPFQTQASPTEEWVPSVKPAANTSFGTRSGGGFKLASETDEANPNDSPGPKPEAATAIEYGLIAALIGGTPDPGREGTYTTTTGEVNAAKTFDYCVIYPERCTVSEIERPTFGPHIITFDKLAGSADPGGDDI